MGSRSTIGRRLARGLALPLIMAVCMGLDLPENGPVPVDNPRQLPSADTPPPVPEEKPAPPEPSSPPADAPDPEAKDAPAPSPSKPAPDTAKPVPDTAKKPAPLPGITAPKEDETALAHCEAQLRKLGAVFDRVEPLTGENGCGIEAPYRIDQIVRGVTLSPATQLRCQTALALARWTGSVVIPAAKALPDTVTLTGINHGSTYVCRRRNNLATGKMSEHAIGNAIDIIDFEFKGRKPIGIVPRAGDGNIEEAFQRAVRGGACLHFTTVLGPGTDASHDDHLHLDIAERRGGYRLCE
ncbi:extensin family protein [Hoeflea sp. BAL378]|uniref:extensin-like domain-containing protein n=1 Tax=Hoeflea sp. BAL378 TaxID=1547437 RepID=UPI000A85214B|nr:extensin family protein [Hoeflea sp. BAL378]